MKTNGPKLKIYINREKIIFTVPPFIGGKPRPKTAPISPSV
jgi:hypothetical protein